MINIDYSDRRPIYEQLVEKIKDLILLGVFEADMQMPSVRALAAELSINPNTIQRAYAELERDGVIYCVKGRGNFVAPVNNLINKHKDKIKKQLGEVIIEAKKADIAYEEFEELVKTMYSQETED